MHTGGGLPISEMADLRLAPKANSRQNRRQPSQRPALSINTNLPVNTALFPQTPINQSFPRATPRNAHARNYSGYLPPPSDMGGASLLPPPPGMYPGSDPLLDYMGFGPLQLTPPSSQQYAPHHHPMSMPVPHRHAHPHHTHSHAHPLPPDVHTPTGADYSLGLGGFGRHNASNGLSLKPEDYAHNSPQHRVPFNDLPFFGAGTGLFPPVGVPHQPHHYNSSRR